MVLSRNRKIQFSWPHDVSMSLQVMLEKWRKLGFLKSLTEAHFWASKKAFWHMLCMMNVGLKNMRKVLETFFISFLWCKNIQGIDRYNIRDHTMSLCRYMLGKWRKLGFLKNLTEANFWASKKSFLTYAMYDECGPKKHGESAWKYSSLVFYDVKTPKESSRYNPRDHTMSLCCYMLGKWRKIGFLKNLTEAYFELQKRLFDICYVWWMRT